MQIQDGRPGDGAAGCTQIHLHIGEERVPSPPHAFPSSPAKKSQGMGRVLAFRTSFCAGGTGLPPQALGMNDSHRTPH